MFPAVACNVAVVPLMAEDWHRVAEHVRARRQHLGIMQKESKVAPATWTKLENAKETSYKSFTLARVEAELRWPPGTIAHIANGGAPPESDADVATRLSIVEDQVAELTRLLRQLPGMTQDDPGSS